MKSLYDENCDSGPMLIGYHAYIRSSFLYWTYDNILENDDHLRRNGDPIRAASPMGGVWRH